MIAPSTTVLELMDTAAGGFDGRVFQACRVGTEPNE